MPTDPGRSRVTGGLRLAVAVWLIGSAVPTLADPQRVSLEQPELFGALLRVAGLSFTLGFFLLTGFMSRVAGLILALLGGWQLANLGFSVLTLVLMAIGVHLMLRGGGAWAMDIYVQKMQDRARGREVEKSRGREPT
jgi:membrane-bound ClpP family serine protease